MPNRILRAPGHKDRWSATAIPTRRRCSSLFNRSRRQATSECCPPPAPQGHGATDRPGTGTRNGGLGLSLGCTGIFLAHKSRQVLCAAAQCTATIGSAHRDYGLECRHVLSQSPKNRHVVARHVGKTTYYDPRSQRLSPTPLLAPASRPHQVRHYAIHASLLLYGITDLLSQDVDVARLGQVSKHRLTPSFQRRF